MPLYHSSPKLLGPGDIVLPGNYGDIIKATGPGHISWEREQVLEQVRTTHFADKPSRLTSTFSCADLPSAQFYRSVPVTRGEKKTADFLYEVEKVKPDAVEHRADFNVVQPLPGRPENMEQIAVLYWTARLWTTVAEAPSIRCEEVVTALPLRIIKQI
jgi:hypothetical protein